MIEPQFSDLFNKMVKHLNRDIKNINGIEYYLIPVKTINELKRLFISQPQNFADESNKIDEIDQEDDDIDVEYYKPFF